MWLVAAPLAQRSAGGGIHAGEIVLVRRSRDHGALLTHRVVTVRPDGSVITRGDANSVDDTSAVRRPRSSEWFAGSYRTWGIWRCWLIRLSRWTWLVPQGRSWRCSARSRPAAAEPAPRLITRV